MNSLIINLIDNVQEEVISIQKSARKYINNQIIRADHLKSMVHKELSRPKVARWTFILTVFIANFLVEV